ncbi:MAG TPA: tRNA lysidine(34) synthetase TilS [Amoebophilaceae bacterium]|nr:tRNA lysidine(34) synthetase TilS [Amoebophilaceae bacterium]
MLTDFLSFVSKHRLIKDHTKPTLIAVSGGVDSIVLCRLFHQAMLPFAIAHCNFKLRGQEADQETQFVQALAQNYQVPCYTRYFETKTFASQYKISTQMAARELRYAFFNELLQLHTLNQVATAHHWDDSVETILFHWIKGSSIWGLQGIPPIQGNTIRPLLFARKEAILCYAHQEGLHWKEDSSNHTIDYQRNFIRHRIIPLLHHINPNFEETTRTTCAKLNDTARIFSEQIQRTTQEVLLFKNGVGYLDIDRIMQLPGSATLAFEILRPYGFTFAQIQTGLAQPLSSGKIMHAHDYVMIIDRKQWLVQPKGTRVPHAVPAYMDVPSLLPSDSIPACIAIHGAPYRLHIQTINPDGYVIPRAAYRAAVDYHTLHFPLQMRPWQPGDRFCPLGMKGTQKVSDFLINTKVPLAVKDRIWVLISNEQIVWIVGYRVDERFKISSKTKKILEIKAE